MLRHRGVVPWARGGWYEGFGLRGGRLASPGADDVPLLLQVTMESPHREAEPGQQEQELRQILNKDKSKRSKSLRVSAGVRHRAPHLCPRSRVPETRGLGSRSEIRVAFRRGLSRRFCPYPAQTLPSFGLKACESIHAERFFWPWPGWCFSFVSFQVMPTRWQ